jgi:hypothetical protein
MDREVMKPLAVALVALIAACTPTKLPLRDFSYYYPQNLYVIAPTQTTPKGVRVDAGGPINLARIDRLFDEVEACLSKTYPGGVLPDEMKSATGASCNVTKFPLPIDRTKIIVKIARDWTWNNTKTDQLLPIDTHDNGCVVKGQTPPCYWRGIVVDPLQLVVPPAMIILKDVLIRVSTGCLNPWATQAMAVCATPTTLGTDDGTGP